MTPPTARAPRRVSDHAMIAALLLSLSVHAAGVLVLSAPRANRGPTTDVVGDSPELMLGFDLPQPPTPAPTPEPPAPTPTPTEAPPAEPAPPEVSRLTETDLSPPGPRPEPLAQVAQAKPAPPAPRPAPAPRPPAPTPPPPVTTPPAAPAVPVAVFAGVKAEQARRVVYAVDISGVMVDSLPFVLAEVQRCVARLGPDQQFQVLLFSDPTPPPGATDNPAGPDHNPLFDGELAKSEAAIPEMSDLLRRARWLGDPDKNPALLDVGEASRARLTDLLTGVKADGVSNPLTGLRLALSMKPDVVFLLTRGIQRNGTPWGPGEAKTMESLEEANPKDGKGRRATTIRTVQFVSPDPTGLLDRIARAHGGGSCTVLTVSDLKKAALPPPVPPRR